MLTHQFKVLLSCWGSYCWKWRVAGLSVFATCSLHQSSLHLHMGKGTITMPLSWLLVSLSHRDAQGGNSSSSRKVELRRGVISCLGVHSPSLTLFVGLWWCSFHSCREPIFLWHYWVVYCFPSFMVDRELSTAVFSFHVFPGLCLFPLRTGWEFVLSPFLFVQLSLAIALRNFVLWACGCWLDVDFHIR